MDNLKERLRDRVSYAEMLLSDPPRPAPDRLCAEAADRIAALEAKLAVAREALKKIDVRLEPTPCDEPEDTARDARLARNFALQALKELDND